ncbi:MAG: hypothetical protein EPO21_22010 [Chloroflexota bacterium]|nr:MAG: hypothetical protein EPO21_22010 [Chloroflexota bacterium]
MNTWRTYGRKLTTEEHIDVIGGTPVQWNENAKPALVLSIPYIERRASDERFLAALREQMRRICRFARRPQDFRGEGISALLPTPVVAELYPMSGTRYTLQLATLGPQPVELLWRSTPGTLFLAIADNMKVAGITVLMEDERAILLRCRDTIAVLAWFIRNLSEPASPPLDFFARL